MNGTPLKTKEGLMGADRQGKCLANQRALVHVGEHQLTDSVHRFCAGGPGCLEKISQPLNLDAYKKKPLGKIWKISLLGLHPQLVRTFL